MLYNVKSSAFCRLFEMLPLGTWIKTAPSMEYWHVVLRALSQFEYLPVNTSPNEVLERAGGTCLRRHGLAEVTYNGVRILELYEHGEGDCAVFAQLANALYYWARTRRTSTVKGLLKAVAGKTMTVVLALSAPPPGSVLSYISVTPPRDAEHLESYRAFMDSHINGNLGCFAVDLGCGGYAFLDEKGPMFARTWDAIARRCLAGLQHHAATPLQFEHTSDPLRAFRFARLGRSVCATMHALRTGVLWRWTLFGFGGLAKGPLALAEVVL